MTLNDVKALRKIYDNESHSCPEKQSCKYCKWNVCPNDCGLNVFLNLIQMAEKKAESEVK